MDAHPHWLRNIGLFIACLTILVACRVDVDAQQVSAAPTNDPGDTPQAEPTAIAAQSDDVERPDKGDKSDPALSSDGTDGSVRDQELPDQPLSRVPPVQATPEPTSTAGDDNPFSDPVNGGGIDYRLTRDDTACDEEDLSAYSNTFFTVAHVVVDGNLGAACFGTPDPRLIESWQILASITPPGQLHDLALFGGYISSEQGESTLAFVNTLDYEGSIYQMSINLEEAEADVDELRLTMAHEFSHVFTSLESQIDRFVLPEECTTWDNGEGCYREDSLMWDWILQFWGPQLLDEIDPFGDPTSAGGDGRCALDSGFLGPYAASRPEEDFAESFSAYVFRLDVDTPGLRAKMDWFARQPGLVEFQDLAIAAGYEPQQNYFQPCG